ncbi:hypothetical protein I5677_02050 [Mobilitalea sibirica]|uniref:Uncharacterized protein n=1 Tax=Mobilitalea sibirica TaxID=1462919 RepID=A0A8J7H0J7_9FIRM|nr:hypothetical protein [Mobilitalea sibirica]MBH1939674.1 hypothetical protein [Mobilitalea sibirica]
MDKKIELEELQKDYEYYISRLKKEHRVFKKRVSIIINLIVPGFGFFIYGKSYYKGVITFLLFYSYTFFFFNRMFSDIDNIFQINYIPPILFYYAPAIIVNLVSTLFVASLKEEE